MQTETSRLTSGTENDTTCRNCSGTGRTTDTVAAAITHRTKTVSRRCRPCKGTGHLAPVAPPAQDEIGEIPPWMLGADEDGNQAEEATQTVKAHELRDGDVIVNREGDNLPVLCVTREPALTFIWTTSTGGFGLSPSCDVEIERRTETIKARDLRKGDIVKRANGDFAKVVQLGLRGGKGLRPWSDPNATIVADFGRDGSRSYGSDDALEIARRDLAKAGA